MKCAQKNKILESGPIFVNFFVVVFFKNVIEPRGLLRGVHCKTESFESKGHSKELLEG